MRLLPILLALVACLTSCSTKPALSPVIPKMPPRAVPVSPEVSKLRDQIASADKSAAVIDHGAKEARQAATAARQEAERLKTQKTATEAELTKLWQDIQVVESRNLFLEAETSKLAANLLDARNAAGRLQEHAAKVDAQNEQLHGGIDQLGEMVGDYATRLTKANTGEAKERTRGDKLAGEIRIYRGVLVVLLILYGLKLFFTRRIF